MPKATRAWGRVSRLYCGLVLERGTVRTSTNRRTPALFSRPAKEASGCVECPTVKNTLERSEQGEGSGADNTEEQVGERIGDAVVQLRAEVKVGEVFIELPGEGAGDGERDGRAALDEGRYGPQPTLPLREAGSEEVSEGKAAGEMRRLVEPQIGLVQARQGSERPGAKNG